MITDQSTPIGNIYHDRDVGVVATYEDVCENTRSIQNH